MIRALLTLGSLLALAPVAAVAIEQPEFRVVEQAGAF